ncbi:MAG: type II/IV secretion system protein [Gammaproteobacteria bacterium]|jgi:type IV pilus assembly protein PilB|nr:type II/IV secretion system protein [Gammaproteobacteria bacterium]
MAMDETLLSPLSGGSGPDSTRLEATVEEASSTPAAAVDETLQAAATDPLPVSSLNVANSVDDFLAIRAPSGRTVEERFPGLIMALIEQQLLTPQDAEKLIQHADNSGKTLFRVLVEEPTIRSVDKICEWVAEKLGIPLLSSETLLLPRVVETEWLPFSRMEDFGLLLLENEQGEISQYGVIDPYDLRIRDTISDCFSEREVNPVLIHPQLFFSLLQRIRSQGRADPVEAEAGIAIDISAEEAVVLRERMDTLDIPRMVNYLLHRAATQVASDIHVEPTEELLMVRNRVDGILHEDTTLPKALCKEIASRIKIISGMDVAEKRRPQDGRFARVVNGKPIDVRVSSFPTVYGEKIVMRLLDKSTLQPSPEHLGLLERDLRILKEKISAPFGMVMISGPTGSGKTTTLYSCLGSIDKEKKNVLTVEDPVEYRLNGVHQMQVNNKIGLNFASGLRTILRQDPDIVMVGECRDQETAAMAVQASLTGHIVFSTIHTNDAVGVVTRLLDMKIEPFLVSSALTLSIAQRLVRKICPHCKTEISGAEVLQQLRREGISLERLSALEIEIDPALGYAQGSGCSYCRDSGYLGRQATFELFEMSNEARRLILSDDFNVDALRAMAIESGMTTLIRHGLGLVEEEVTTFSEIIRVLGEC